MFTYKQLRKYNNTILKNMLETEKKDKLEYYEYNITIIGHKENLK